MAEDVLVDAFDRVSRFRGDKFAMVVSRLEGLVAHQDRRGLGALVVAELVTLELLRAAVLVKRSAAQIDSVVHAAGMLLCLPEILEDGEVIEAVSLAASNTGRAFDLVTDRRIAEFTFIDWKGGAESIRKQKLFKDFYQLAETDTTKRRYLYFLGDRHAQKVFTSKSTCKGMLRKYAILREDCVEKYGEKLQVREYYTPRRDLVVLESLERVAPVAAVAFEQALQANIV
jgi:hypothetical protein